MPLKDLAYTHLSVMRETEAAQLQLIIDIENKAQANMARETEWKSAVEQWQSESEAIAQLKHEYNELMARQQRVAGRFAWPNVLRLLDVGVSTMEESSDKQRAAFEAACTHAQTQTQTQSGSAAQTQTRTQTQTQTVDPQTVLDAFIKDRTLMHERAAKKERVMEIYGQR